MSKEEETPETGEEREAKPTITIAERESSTSDAKPTITIAERTENP